MFDELNKYKSDHFFFNSNDNMMQVCNAPTDKSGVRRTSWPQRMKLESIEALYIYWYVTYDDVNKDFPEDVERTLLQHHISIYERLPRWNKI